jgi:hypothetical protein
MTHASLSLARLPVPLQSELGFVLLQQAQAAQQAVLLRGTEAGYTPATALISIPLHQASFGACKAPPDSCDATSATENRSASPHGPDQQPKLQHGPPAQPQGPSAIPLMPSRPAALHQQPLEAHSMPHEQPVLHHQAAPQLQPLPLELPSLEQQREPVTMRPLYAVPRQQVVVS